MRQGHVPIVLLEKGFPVPNTSTNGQYDQTVQIVRNAIPRMSELKIPITPSNYAVWYEYLSETNQALRQEMDALLSRGQPIINGEMKGLYERFLKERTEEQWMAKTALSQMVSTLMSRAVRATNIVLEQGMELKQRLSSLATEMEDVRGQLERSQKEARADALTGLHNRLAFQEELAALPRFAAQDTHAPCLLVVDIDYFKRINDTYGHLAGDHVLRAVAHEVKACVRGRDMVARYGGEEFAVLLRETPHSGCRAVAEHVRTGRGVRRSCRPGPLPVERGRA